jgi:hypothetical protein
LSLGHVKEIVLFEVGYRADTAHEAKSKQHSAPTTLLSGPDPHTLWVSGGIPERSALHPFGVWGLSLYWALFLLDSLRWASA